MQTSKKFISMLVVLAMVLGMMPTMALAEGTNEAAITRDRDSSYYYVYETLAGAVAAAENGDTVTLLKNVILEDDPIVIPDGKSVTLDTDIYTLSGVATVAATSNLIQVSSGAELTLTGNGKITFVATSPILNGARVTPANIPAMRATPSKTKAS